MILRALGFLRYILFDGDIADLVLDSKNCPPGTTFEGQLPPKTLDIERKVWDMITNTAKPLLQKMADNDKDTPITASGNTKTALRMLEKERSTWQWIVKTSELMLPLMDMTKKEATKAINTDTKGKYKQYAVYYEVAILPLLN